MQHWLCNHYLLFVLPVTTDVQNPSVRYVNNSVNLTCEFAEGSTAEGCLFNFTGVTTQQPFFVNRSGDSPVASRCAIARAFANNTDYTWNAFDDIGGTPVTVELIAVDSQDENNFTCLSLLSGRHMHSLFPGPSFFHFYSFCILFLNTCCYVFFPNALSLSCIVKAYTSKIGGCLGTRLKYVTGIG